MGVNDGGKKSRKNIYQYPSQDINIKDRAEDQWVVQTIYSQTSLHQSYLR